MPTMSFSSATEATSQELATTTPAAIVKTYDSPTAAVQGEINQTDIRLPRVNLVQKMSETAEVFKFGDIIFEKTVKIGDLNTPVGITVLGIKKQYQQDLPYGSEEMPMVFDTSEQVRAAGGSVIPRSENYFAEIAHIRLVIEAPESLSEEELEFFPYQFNDKSYAQAVITVGRSAYGTFAKPLITHAFNTLKDCLWAGKFELHADLKKSPKGSYVVPVPVYKGRHETEVANFFKSLI